MEPIKQKTRGVPQCYREELRKPLMDMKEAGMIIDSKSPWSSPIRLVKKPDSSIRVCVDFRKVNNYHILLKTVRFRRILIWSELLVRLKDQKR